MKKRANAAPSEAKGEVSTEKYAARRTSPTRDEIAQLAFTLYESRGCQDGYDVEDWMRAEKELVRHSA